ncbi:RtcB family protein [Roseospira marina]|uniref:3'-phosphate/5'-hydroxy nucleic acid ligase n=1 Tax=Roseospira marina TaxID=140057 RepID=A0A5M6I7X1_9PROT|nr:RtcB family protein [Roseospira marina]KAA5604374.1 RtcB family protein [Roseospira marina]MBB4315439.1 tRNA-splicing ligase RtcB [Roseospira marina]MBB5088415.1 tRNA-splicing ligase RtcB [Roseospira marina]
MSKPIKIYGEENIDPAAIHQFHEALKCDFSVKGALMPDAHKGYALPIGAVVATQDVVVPAWVGYDIGCGMCALPFVGVDPDELRAKAHALLNDIYVAVPVGFKHNANGFPASSLCLLDRSWVIQDQLDAGAWCQLGTLGGGNHFIEIGLDEVDQVWVVIHSGSRNLGHKVATHWMKVASGDGKAREGHFGLRTDVPGGDGKQYLTDTFFCQEFALVNRMSILSRVIRCLHERLDQGGPAAMTDVINRNHNHVVERDGLWIHRKGATHAEEDMLGVIPGNMRDGSFIVRGLGNPESLWSSSHGAGRVLGRRAARETLSMETFRESMTGIAARVVEETLDESPDAYKNPFDVMRMQTELVAIERHIRPVINIKG